MQLLKFRLIFTFTVMLLFASLMLCFPLESEPNPLIPRGSQSLHSITDPRVISVGHKTGGPEYDVFHHMDELRKRHGKNRYHYYSTKKEKNISYSDDYSGLPGLADDPILQKLLKGSGYKIYYMTEEQYLKQSGGSRTPEEVAVKLKFYNKKPILFKVQRQDSQSEDLTKVGVTLMTISFALLALTAFPKVIACCIRCFRNRPV